MAGVESKLRQDITPTSDTDPLSGSVGSQVVRYLASFAMTAVATVVAVGIDTKVNHGNLAVFAVIESIQWDVRSILAAIDREQPGTGRRFGRWAWRYLGNTAPAIAPTAGNCQQRSQHRYP